MPNDTRGRALRLALLLGISGSLLLGCTSTAGDDGAARPAALPTRTVTPQEADELMGSWVNPVPERAKGDQPDSLAAARRSELLLSRERVSGKLRFAGDQDWFRFKVTENTRMTADLSNLATNQTLTVFDASGRRVAHSDRPGRQFERVYWSASPGNYYARVALGKGGVPPGNRRSPGYRFIFRQLPAGVVIESINPDGGRGEPNAVYMTAELLNTTSSWQQLGAVYVDQPNDAGKVVQRDPMMLPVRLLKPYGKLVLTSGPVHINSHWGRWLITPVVTPASPRTVPDLRITGYRRVHTGGDVTYSGQVRNDGTAAIDAGTALIARRCYDDGMIHDAGYIPVPALPAGGSAPFRFTIKGEYRPNQLELVAPIR